MSASISDVTSHSETSNSTNAILKNVRKKKNTKKVMETYTVQGWAIPVPECRLVFCKF